jgi:hypothetical protein
MINLDKLLTWLNQSTLQTNNPPLYQLLKTLVAAIREFQAEQTAINESTSGGISTLSDLDLLTHTDESASLPYSRQLIAGTNVSFDDSVINERTINSTGGGGSSDDYVVMSDGAIPPSPMDDGNGNFIYVTYTP